MTRSGHSLGNGIHLQNVASDFIGHTAAPRMQPEAFVYLFVHARARAIVRR